MAGTQRNPQEGICPLRCVTGASREGSQVTRYFHCLKKEPKSPWRGTDSDYIPQKSAFPEDALGKLTQGWGTTHLQTMETSGSGKNLRKKKKKLKRSSSPSIPSSARMMKGAGGEFVRERRKSRGAQGGRVGAGACSEPLSQAWQIPSRPACLIVLDVFSVPQERRADLAAPDV